MVLFTEIGNIEEKDILRGDSVNMLHLRQLSVELPTSLDLREKLKLEI